MGKKNDEYVINGYRFESYEDYCDALNEKNGIKYLDEQIDLNDTEKLLAIYNDLHDRKVFRTTIGIEYMRMLRSTLRHKLGHDDGLRYVEVPASVRVLGDRSAKTSDNSQVSKLKDTVAKLTKQKKMFIVSIAVLAVVIVAMFIISATSSSTNIINYKHKIENEYASWQSELYKKEQELNEREYELNHMDDN